MAVGHPTLHGAGAQSLVEVELKSGQGNATNQHPQGEENPAMAQPLNPGVAALKLAQV